MKQEDNFMKKIQRQRVLESTLYIPLWNIMYSADFGRRVVMALISISSD